jgi:hypothetical protein
MHYKLFIIEEDCDLVLALIALGSVRAVALEPSIFADAVNRIGLGLGVHPVEFVGPVTAIECDASML